MNDKIIEKLSKRYDVQLAENENPFKVLISTLISQRTREENTRKSSERLFSFYDNPTKILEASLDEIEGLIKLSGFYRVKAKRIKDICKILVEEYNGKVPDGLGDLLRLPGVGRKTANCVLAYGFGKEAIPVDTHVHRISNRIGWVNTRTPGETEVALKKVVPRKYWIRFNKLLVEFGKDTCRPVKPRCEDCIINKYCRYFNE